MPKWAICLDAPALLDDLQPVLANLGVITGRISKYNKRHAKYFDEVYATGEHAQRLAMLVPFMEREKAQRATTAVRVFRTEHATADVMPGIVPRDLFGLLPHEAHKTSIFCATRERNALVTFA